MFLVDTDVLSEGRKGAKAGRSCRTASPKKAAKWLQTVTG